MTQVPTQEEFEALLARVALLETVVAGLAAGPVGARFERLGGGTLELAGAVDDECDLVEATSGEMLFILAIVPIASASSFTPVRVDYDAVAPSSTHHSAFVLSLPNLTAGAPLIVETERVPVVLPNVATPFVAGVPVVLPGGRLRARLVTPSGQTVSLAHHVIGLRVPA